MNDPIQGYYLSERATAILASATGIAMLLAAAVFWRVAHAASVQRGMAYALTTAGLLLALTSGTYIFVEQQRANAAVAHQWKSEAQAKEAEIARVRTTLHSGYRGALITFTALICIGLGLTFVSHERPVRKGVAVALLLVGALGHCIEAISMQKNQQYLERVEAYQAVRRT